MPTLKQLHDFAKEKGVKGLKGLKKADIIDKLKTEGHDLSCLEQTEVVPSTVPPGECPVHKAAPVEPNEEKTTKKPSERTLFLTEYRAKHGCSYKDALKNATKKEWGEWLVSRG